ncbi:hypothetical protein I8752_28420 [Nostocaceae cyanobacterium CENA369]|uniref:Uncharacterized protein n=1 Tax=Dendronalium phyllosphericum CENA369 TaxID=1725256 RepID=A0A8J7LIL3_9NOST|nr:hypothetical protein [Dendronalium phyllosphericum]MBH8576844.1 hypothetical protein [Dendronalium phyllosphericum CENA369]
MTCTKEDTFTKYKEYSDFLVVSEPSPSDLKVNKNVRSNCNGRQFPNAKFFPNHDIFHFIFEKGWIHDTYKGRNGKILENFSSYAYHGESIIELCTRFFGNLKNELIYVHREQEGLPKGEYLELPILQLGVRKKNQPKRVFPILFEVLEEGNFYLTNEFNSETVFDYMGYVIIASLVSGNGAELFLEYLEEKYNNKQNWMNRKFFYSADFKNIVKDFILNPERELPIHLNELNAFLVQDDTSLYKTIQYCEKCLKVFYQVFLNPKFDRIYKTDTSYLFPVHSSKDRMTFMGYLFFINRSANLVYENNFKSLTIKHGIKPKSRRYLQNLLCRLKLLEEEIYCLEMLRDKIKFGNINISQKVLYNVENKLIILHKHIKNIPDSSKILISENTEKYFGFCCINPRVSDFIQDIFR